MEELKRDYKIWAYSISHGSLLLRSFKNSKHQKRKDILLKDVRGMSLQCDLNKLEITEHEVSATHLLPDELKKDYGLGAVIFKLNCSEWSGIVVAGSIHYNEDDGEFGEPSALWDGNY